MKRNFIITKDGQICIKTTFLETKVLLENYTIKIFFPESNSLSEYSVCTEDELTNDFNNPNGYVVAIVGELPSIFDENEFVGEVEGHNVRAFAEMCNIEPLIVLGSLL